jgi:EAL domain-containing protein (putative c-di-GMP-specific phosphodiesterase class I)
MQWQNDSKGVIKGDVFWKLADQCGLTHSINQHLLELTVKQLQSWKSDPNYRERKIGMSLSIEHLLHKKSLDNLLQLIEWADIDSDHLVIELSEQALGRFNKYLPNILYQLHNAGVLLVLDDFGGETAAIGYLFQYDFDFIKLSEKLTNTISMSDKSHKLAQSIIMIANNAGIEVIADGVNEEDVKEELNFISCHYIQGHIAGGPITI